MADHIRVVGFNHERSTPSSQEPGKNTFYAALSPSPGQAWRTIFMASARQANLAWQLDGDDVRFVCDPEIAQQAVTNLKGAVEQANWAYERHSAKQERAEQQAEQDRAAQDAAFRSVLNNVKFD